MLRWTSRPDIVFNEILINALELYRDSLKEAFDDEDDHLIKVFGKKGLGIELEKIITAHNSNKIFSVTDYHFLILYNALEQFCDLYNDLHFDQLSFGGIQPSHLDFELMVTMYFWDTDFLFDQEIMNNLSVDQKDGMSISPDVFSIANNLKPHADELIISENR
jgi:hypothetical protein